MLEDICHTEISGDEDDQISDALVWDEMRTEKAFEHLEEMDKLPEPLRTRSLKALEELSLRRGCARQGVLESVERRMYQNIYKPAMKARRIQL